MVRACARPAMYRHWLPGAVVLGLLAASVGCGPGQPERLAFAAVGTTGTGGLAQRAVGRSMAATGRDEGLDFVLLLGDSFRRHGVADEHDPQWTHKFVEAYPEDGLPVPFYAVAGNRDHRGSLAALTGYDGDERWRMPALWYRFDQALAEGRTATFIGLDTTSLKRGDAVAREQTDWLARSLETLEPGWLIVFAHDPVIQVSGARDPDLAHLLPLLQRHGLDAYSSGEQAVLALQRDAAGALHVASGAGAMMIDLPPAPGVLALVPRQGFAHVRLDADGLELRFIDRDGNVRHRTVSREHRNGERG